MIQFGGLVAIANTSLALLAVAVLWLDPALVWLLVLPLVTVFLAYRAYVSEREKHERLEMLYQSSRILQHSPELDVGARGPARPRPRDVPGRARRGPVRRPAIPRSTRRCGRRPATTAGTEADGPVDRSRTPTASHAERRARADAPFFSTSRRTAGDRR